MTQITNFHFCPIGNGRKLATMAQIKRENLAVPCKNYAAHMLVHLIPIADRFPVKTTIECDICGDENEYFPEEILVDLASS